MVPFYVVTGCLDVVSNSIKVIRFQKGLEMFCFPVVKSSFNVKIVTIPATI